mmetsp:Transcript_21247/g.50411  ORF Transcript_21247/g.50411 Transcript_21247/m.50411 type:complete len:81 (+) Transcript_21247:61-303(+)
MAASSQSDDAKNEEKFAKMVKNFEMITRTEAVGRKVFGTLLASSGVAIVLCGKTESVGLRWVTGVLSLGVFTFMNGVNSE